MLLTLGVQRDVLRRRDRAGDHAGGGAVDALDAVPAGAPRPVARAALRRRAGRCASTRRRRPARSSSRASGASARWWRACSTAPAISRPSSTTTRTTSSSRAASAFASSTATPRAWTCSKPPAPASADFLIIALDDPGATTRLARIAIKHFPKLRVIARARDMRHMFELRDLGVRDHRARDLQVGARAGRSDAGGGRRATPSARERAVRSLRRTRQRGAGEALRRAQERPRRPRLGVQRTARPVRPDAARGRSGARR